MVTTGFKTMIWLDGRYEPVVVVSKVQLPNEGEVEVWGYTLFALEMGVEFCMKMHVDDECDCVFCIPELVEVLA